MTTTTAPAIPAKQRAGDRWFSGTALFAGSMILVTLAGGTLAAGGGTDAIGGFCKAHYLRRALSSCLQTEHEGVIS